MVGGKPWCKVLLGNCRCFLGNELLLYFPGSWKLGSYGCEVWIVQNKSTSGLIVRSLWVDSLHTAVDDHDSCIVQVPKCGLPALCKTSEEIQTLPCLAVCSLIFNSNSNDFLLFLCSVKILYSSIYCTLTCIISCNWVFPPICPVSSKY